VLDCTWDDNEQTRKIERKILGLKKNAEVLVSKERIMHCKKGPEVKYSII
jgi:hypothetical protein